MATSAPATPTTSTSTTPPNPPTLPNSAAGTAPDAQKRLDAIIAVAGAACNAPGKGQTNIANLTKYLPYMMKAFAEAGITSKSQLAAMIGTIYVETGSWDITVKEDPVTGICQGGDAYCGRGPIQITHKDKYELLAKLTGQDFVGNPDLLCEPSIAAKAMVMYWKGEFGNTPISPPAEAGDGVGVRKAINGGSNGLEEFLFTFNQLQTTLPEGISPDMIGVTPSANHGVVSCADGGSGTNKTILAPGASSQSDVLAYALGLNRLDNQKLYTVKLLLNANAQPEILKLEQQQTFKLVGLGEPTPAAASTTSPAATSSSSISSTTTTSKATAPTGTTTNSITNPIEKAQSGVSPEAAIANVQAKDPTKLTPSPNSTAITTAPVTPTIAASVDTGYEGDYTIEEISFYLETEGWLVEIIAYKPDPNAPSPSVFVHDPSATGDKAGVAGAAALPKNPSEINGKLLAAAKSNIGQSSAAGPGGGNVACAWCMQHYVFNPALGHPIGADSVESVVIEMEQNGYGVPVERDNVLAGDVIIMGDHIGHHIGIALTDKGTEILSNSSSGRAFQWIDNFDGYDAFYSAGKTRAYRIVKP